VANHQIRNLKSLLIEDTVKFESHYHLDRLVNGRSKVNIDAAQQWWLQATAKLQTPNPELPRNSARHQTESFVRAVVATLFTKEGYADFPDTFYLDHERLRLIKAEIDNMIYFEVCFGMFSHLLKEFGHTEPASLALRNQLHTSLTAIVGEGAVHRPHLWILNSEPVSLEIYRQARMVTNRSPLYHTDDLHRSNHHLRNLFRNSYAAHASVLQATLLPHVVACSTKHYNSSPMELFNSLVVSVPPAQPHSFISVLTPSPNTLTPSSIAHKISDISNRIAHISLIHWRVWRLIAYIQDDKIPSSFPLLPCPTPPLPGTDSSPPPQAPPTHTESHSPDSDESMGVKPPDPGETGARRS
jgi:hypothetical protein